VKRSVFGGAERDKMWYRVIIECLVEVGGRFLSIYPFFGPFLFCSSNNIKFDIEQFYLFFRAVVSQSYIFCRLYDTVIKRLLTDLLIDFHNAKFQNRIMQPHKIIQRKLLRSCLQ